MGVIHEKINYALEHSLEEPIMTLNSTLWPHHSMFLNFIHVECFVHIELIQFIIHIYVPIDIVQFHPYYQVQHVFMFHPKNVQIVQLNPTCFHVSSKECSNSSTISNMLSCFIQIMLKQSNSIQHVFMCHPKNIQIIQYHPKWLDMSMFYISPICRVGCVPSICPNFWL